MPSEIPQLLEALDSVTAIPIIPFKDDKIDYTGHAKNIDYLMRNNYLDQERQPGHCYCWNEPHPPHQ